MFLFPVHFLSKLAQSVSKIKSKIAHSFHKERDLDDDLAGTSI
jgi:hypothetical protein